MAVSLPTSADVRKVRSQATKAVNTQLDVVKTPLLAWVGAGDLAVTKAGEVVDKAKARATERRALAAERRERLQAQIKDLPTELRETLSAEELKKRYEELTAEAKTRYEDVTGEVKKAYTELADRGEVTVEKIRKQPRVKRVLDGVADANDELEKRGEKARADRHDPGEEVLGKVSTQTRSVGEKAARATQKFTSEAAESVTEAGNDLAAEVKEAGTEAAATTRSVTRKAANRTAPKKPAAKRTNASSVK
jgi:heparin binding hemagglutinin HbhA